MDKNFRFRSRDGFLFLTSYIGNDEIVKIPQTHKGKPVTGITRKCFANCDNHIKYKITEIIIPDTVLIIERLAFSDLENLEKIHMPKYLVILENYVFYMCFKLTEITLYENVKKIGQSCFELCDSLTKVTCYSKEISVSKSAFNSSLPLQDVSFNLISHLDQSFHVPLTENVFNKFKDYTKEEQNQIISNTNKKQNLKKGLFLSNNSDIISILLENKIKISIHLLNDILDYHIAENNTTIVAMLLEFKESNFSKQDVSNARERKELVDIGLELPTFSEFRKDWKFSKRDGKIIISGYKGLSTEQTIPVSLNDGTPITKICVGEKGGFSGLEVLRIEANFTAIEDSAFIGTSDLKEVVLPESLVMIRSSAFAHCINLEKINFTSTLEFIGDWAFINCQSLINIEFSDFDETDILKKYLKIGSNAFYHCLNLKKIKLSNRINIISYNTFLSCHSLEEIIIPESVLEIGWLAFSECKNLKKVLILGKIKILENGLFSDCENLTEITLPDTLEEISSKAFYKCTSLEEITIPASVKVMEDNIFLNCINLKQVNFLGDVPDDFKEYESFKINKINK